MQDESPKKIIEEISLLMNQQGKRPETRGGAEPLERIRDGDGSGIKLALELFAGEELPALSVNPLQSKKYQLTITAAVLGRMCVEKGMLPDEVAGLGNIYIRKADRCVENSQVEAVYKEMLQDFAERMKPAEKPEKHSAIITRCMRYISRHLNEPLRLSQIADALGVSASYLSKSFTKETGMSLSAYIRVKKIEAAKVLLAHTEYSCTEIAEYLSFSSPAHFTKLFREAVGSTPVQYRNHFFQMA